MHEDKNIKHNIKNNKNNIIKVKNINYITGYHVQDIRYMP